MPRRGQKRNPAESRSCGLTPSDFTSGNIVRPRRPIENDDASANSERRFDFEAVKRRLRKRRLPPDMLDICQNIVDALSELAPEERKEINPDYFGMRIPVPERKKLAAALTFLGTMTNPILSVNSYLKTEHGRIYLSNDELHDLLAEGELNHPHTGEPISNPLDQVYIFYSFMDESAI